MSHRLNQKKLLASLLSTILLFVSGAAMASQDIQVLTKACVACHGKNGNSNNSAWPNLAGQKRTYLAMQLRNFRSGARKNLLMDDIVKNLSDTQIEALANYYSEQSVVIKKHE
ncbi:MAG: cytochrome c, partial [Kangiellaceae bacterium]|nr:cytochrome c [Kangiellaceae bacterium]